jgi:hypothetical protein
MEARSNEWCQYKIDKYMKKIILNLVAIALLLCINACHKYRFDDVPACIKERIEKRKKEGYSIKHVKEYRNTDGTKKMYHLVEKRPLAPGIIMYDENCNTILVQSEEFTWVAGVSAKHLKFGYLQPDGTVEYDGDIYRFKRIVYK